MNVQNIAEKVFAIMRDMPPDDEGWTIVELSDGGIQIVGEWNRCKEQPAREIAVEFMRRLSRANDDYIEGNVSCDLRSQMVTPSTRQLLWHVEVSIILEDTSTSDLLMSAAAVCWRDTNSGKVLNVDGVPVAEVEQGGKS